MVALLLRWQGLRPDIAKRPRRFDACPRVPIVDLCSGRLQPSNPRSIATLERRPQGFSRIKVIAALDTARGAAAVDLPLRACDTDDPLGLQRFGSLISEAILEQQGPTHTVMSSRMNQCGIPVAGARRSAIGGARDQRPARMAVVDRRHADPVGQSGRRTRVRRRQCCSALAKRSSARPIRIGGRSRGSRAACRRTALSGWSDCKVLAPPPAGLRPAAVRGSISPMAATAF